MPGDSVKVAVRVRPFNQVIFINLTFKLNNSSEIRTQLLEMTFPP